MENSLRKMGTISCVNQEDIEKLLACLQRNGFHIFELDGQDIRGAESFFARIKGAFPQDPPLSGRCNWDAFLDSLWGGLDELGEEKVAFVWTGVENMLKGGLPDLLEAAICFDSLASSVYSPETGISKRVVLQTFLVGRGENFKPFEK